MHIARLFLGILILLGSALIAEINESDFGSETIAPKTAPPGPFKFAGTYDGIGKSKFKNSIFKGEKISFNQSVVEASSVIYYNPNVKEGVSLDLCYQWTNVDWRENPFFDEKLFRTVTLSLSGATKRFEDWLWRAQLSINVDARHFNIDDYAYYDFILWGRYDYCSNLGVHIGFLGETGMKIEHVYPIIGIDWRATDRWQINLVLPVNLSVLYSITEEWSLAIATRFFDVRHRVGKHESLPEGLFVYRNAGLEFAVNYDTGSWFKANLHVGTTTGGTFKIANRNYHHRRRFKFRSAGYLGGEIVARF